MAAAETLFFSRISGKQFIFITLLLFFLSGLNQANAQISTLNNWTSVYHGTATTAKTSTYTVPTGSNSNRVLVVAIASSTTAANTRTVALTYGGQTPTGSAGDISGNNIQHTQIYYFNETKLDAATNTTLSVAVSGGTTSMTDVFAAVFDGVDQSSPITNSQTYNSGTSAVDPFQFSTALTVNANDQAVEIISTVRMGSRTSITISSYPTNWTSGASEQTGSYNTSPNSNDQGIRNAVANRNIPVSNTTDVSSVNLSGTARVSMTALSLKAYIPTITNFDPVNACSGSGAAVVITGTNFTGATAVTFNGHSATFNVNSATQITATLPSTATTGKIIITTGGGNAQSTNDFTVNPLPNISTQPSATTICLGQTASLLVASSASSPIYQWQSSTDNTNWSYISSPFNSNPVFFESDFSSLPSNTNVYGNASITGGVLQLTPATGSQNGGYVIQSTPGANFTAFNVTFDYQIWDGSGADGFSVSYAPNIANNSGPGEEGEGTGIIVKFDTYDNNSGTNTNSQIRVNYNNNQIWTNALGAFNLRNANYRNINIYVDPNGNLTLTIGGTTIFSNLSLPGYAAADKTSWKFKFSGRTGGLNDAHRIDNLKIQFGDDPTLSVSPGSNTYYRAIITSGNCSVNSNSALVTVNTPSTAPTSITGTSIICSGGTTTLTASGGTLATGGTYEWGTGSTIGSNIINGETGVSYNTPTLSTTTTYWVRRKDTAPCNTETGGVTATVTVRPVFTSGAIATTGETICSSGDPGVIGSFTVASGGDNSIIYEWRANGTPIASTNSATYDPPTGLTTTTTYTRWAKDNTCNTTFTQSTGSWVVTVDPLPIITTQPSNLTLCEGGSGSFTVVTSASSPSYQWQYSTPANPTNWLAIPNAAGLIEGATTAGLQILSANVVWNEYNIRCAVNSNGCITELEAVKLFIHAPPTTANAGSDQSNCNSSIFTLSGNAPTIGTGSWSLISGIATITTPTSRTSTVTGVPAGSSATLRWTISNGICISSSDDVLLTNNALPAAYNVIGGGTFCTEGINIGLNGSQSGINYQLYNGAATVGEPVAGNGSEISFGAHTAAGIYTVLATNATTNCTNNMNGNAIITLDTETPVANCIANLTVFLDAGGQATITPAMIDNGSSDNCGIASMTVNPSVLGCNSDAGFSKDVISSDGYTVHIKITDYQIEPSTMSCAFGYNYDMAYSYEISFSGSNIPTNLYTLQVTFGCSNPLQGSLSTTPVTASGKTWNNIWKSESDCATLTSEILGCNTISVLIEGPGIPSQTITLDPVGGGSNTVTLTVTDAAGNSSTCTTNVVVADDIPPTISCTPTITVLADENSCLATGVNLGTPTTSDNCGVASVTNNAPAGFPVGNTTVTWTATDNTGNTSTCEQTVTVNPLPIDVSVADFDNTCQSGESGSTTTITWTINKTGGAGSWGFNWEVRNGSLVVVDSGTVTGIAGGNTTLSFTNSDNTEGINQTYSVIIAGVADNCGTTETNTGNNSDTVILFGIPATGEIIPD